MPNRSDLGSRKRKPKIPMRLAEFIRLHSDAIVAEWETFAATIQPATSNMSRSELREHAADLLAAAADDLDREQTRKEQSEKSKGRGTARRMALVARNHAIQRLQAGFRLSEVLAEYRALRATVARLWEDASPRPSATIRRDLSRFHEAIDEALTESINRYAAQVDEYRDQFLAVLGHDLRNPLGAISMSATALTRAAGISGQHAAVARRILSASGRITRMVTDLLVLTRSRLGESITITRQDTDLGAVCGQMIDELRAVHPDRQLLLECSGDLRGYWDGGSLAQIISNLVANAIQHGDVTKPVTTRAASGQGTVVLTVHNRGNKIRSTSLKAIFDPMVSSSQGQDYKGQPANLGLGLFIVRELANAHHGTVGVTSTDEDGTTFTVTLPRTDRCERRPPRSTTRRRAHFGSLRVGT